MIIITVTGTSIDTTMEAGTEVDVPSTIETVEAFEGPWGWIVMTLTMVVVEAVVAAAADGVLIIDAGIADLRRVEEVCRMTRITTGVVVGRTTNRAIDRRLHRRPVRPIVA
jgi:hypothetical protein